MLCWDSRYLDIYTGSSTRNSKIINLNLIHSHAYLKDDFKPLSVDPTKPGKLKVADDEVTVQLPLGQVCIIS